MCIWVFRRYFLSFFLFFFVVVCIVWSGIYIFGWSFSESLMNKKKPKKLFKEIEKERENERDLLFCLFSYWSLCWGSISSQYSCVYVCFIHSLYMSVVSACEFLINDVSPSNTQKPSKWVREKISRKKIQQKESKKKWKKSRTSVAECFESWMPFGWLVGWLDGWWIKKKKKMKKKKKITTRKCVCVCVFRWKKN